MKIIRLTTLLDFGGIESKMANLSTHSDDNEWIFCALGKGGAAEKKISQNNKKVVCFNLTYKIPSIRTIVKLYSYFKEQQPDVVHCSGSEANFHGIIAAKMAKVPVKIAEEIGLPSHSKVAKYIFRFIYQLCDFVVGESQVVIENLKTNYTIADNNLKLVSNFALFPIAETISLQQSKEEFKIVSVSRLEPIKNIEGILKVIKRLKQDRIKIKYMIVGEGSSKKTLQDFTKKLNLENEVFFAGYQEDTKKYYLDADLYVLNSFSEGFSNSLLEAMYFKKPSITSAVGAANEIIKNDVNGWIVAINDEDDLYLKIEKCIKLTPDKRIKIGNNAHVAVVENFSLQYHINSLLQLYTSKG